MNGVENPMLLNEYGVPLYKYENGEIKARTDEELKADKRYLKAQKQARIAELKAMLANTDYVACKIAEGSATAEEYAEVIADRQAWRIEINGLTDNE